MDWPAVFIWKELIAANPDAKVVLTIRDPESWYESASKTIFPRMLAYEAHVAFATGIEAEAQAQAICMQTQDFERAYHAFVAKEKPVFKGN